MCVWFSLQHFIETFLVLRICQPDIIVHRSSYEVASIIIILY